MRAYVKGNESLFLQELLVIMGDADVSDSIPWKFVDINGIQGRYLEENGGIKSLNWKKGKLNLRISNYAYKGSGYTNTSLDLDEMVKMAGSVR